MSSMRWSMMVALSALPLLGETIVEQTAGTQNVRQAVFFGQSFTTPGGGPWRNITFNFFSDRGVTPAAAGTVYVFTSAYNGTPSALSTSQYVARSTGISNGSYVFDPSFVLQSNTRYFVYASRTAANIPGGINVSQANAGGNLFTCCSGGPTFRSVPAGNANFRVSGNTASLPPVLTQSFVPTKVALYSTHALYFEITNPNRNVALTGIAFKDMLPGVMVVGTPNNVSNNCGGTVTAPPNSLSIAFSGGALAAQASCTISVDVKALKPELFTNTTEPISSDQSGPGAASVVQGRVIGPGVARKTFAAATVPLGSTTSLTFTVSNQNRGTYLVNIGFSDDLPAGLQIASPNHLTGSCITDEGAAVTAPPGGRNITLWSLVLSAAGSDPASCTISVNVVAVQAGVQENVSGPITATFDEGSGDFVGLSGSPARATIVITH